MPLTMLQLMIRTRNLDGPYICGQVAAQSNGLLFRLPPCLHQASQLKVEILIDSSFFSSHNMIESKENEPLSLTPYSSNNKRNGLDGNVPNHRNNDSRAIFLNEWSFMDAHRGPWDLYAGLIMDENNTAHYGCCNVRGSTRKNWKKTNHMQNQGCNHGGFRQCLFLIPRKEELVVSQCQEWPYWQYLGECEPSIMRMEIHERIAWLNSSMSHEQTTNSITTCHFPLYVFMESVHSYYYQNITSSTVPMVPKINRRVHDISKAKNGSSSAVQRRSGVGGTKAERAVQITDGSIDGVQDQSLRMDGQRYECRQRNVSSRSRPKPRLNQPLQHKQAVPSFPAQEMTVVKKEMDSPEPSSFWRAKGGPVAQVLSCGCDKLLSHSANHDASKSVENDRYKYPRPPIKPMGKVHHHSTRNMVDAPRFRPCGDCFTSKSKRRGQNSTSAPATTKLLTRDNFNHANDNFMTQDRTAIAWRSILWE